jgi:copper chaperone CopZ
MLRRHFIGRLGFLGAGSLASIALAGRDHGHVHTGEQKSLRYTVRGFTCITCAVGLETLLSREEGVLSAKVDYASSIADIRYDPALLDDSRLRAFIQDAGFSATRMSG